MTDERLERLAQWMEEQAAEADREARLSGTPSDEFWGKRDAYHHCARYLYEEASTWPGDRGSDDSAHRAPDPDRSSPESVGTSSAEPDCDYCTAVQMRDWDAIEHGNLRCTCSPEPSEGRWTLFIGRGCGSITVNRMRQHADCTCKTGGNSEACPDDAIEVIPASRQAEEGWRQANEVLDKLHAAERKLAEVERERDEAEERARNLDESYSDEAAELQEQLEAAYHECDEAHRARDDARAEVERLKGVLERIRGVQASGHPSQYGYLEAYILMRNIARAALAETENE